MSSTLDVSLGGYARPMSRVSPASASPSGDHRPFLPLPDVLEALEAWRATPGTDATDRLRAALEVAAAALDLEIGRLTVVMPPLPELDLTVGPGTSGAEIVLRAPGESAPIGSVRITGDRDSASSLARAVELLLVATRNSAKASRAARQLNALDQAVRGISGVLDVDLVLQLIVDRVRELADAQYAALGIVDDTGSIERFITSGLDDEERARIGDLPHGRGLLGLIIREDRTYRIPEISVHPERYGFPPNHPEMHSFLGMPITSRGETVGLLYLTNKIDAGQFSADDQALVEMFALHAGIAIENTRLLHQVKRLAVVDERDRISRDLHDSVIQSIYAQTLALDDVPELMSEDAAEASRRVDGAIDALHAVIRDIRNFIFGLRPVLLESGDLAEGLEHLAAELRRNGGVEVHVSVSDDAALLPQLPMEHIAELLAITREGLSNIARHAAASRADVNLALADGALQLELADDGRGFDAERATEEGHHGLGNMHARVNRLGGTLTVASSADSGTRIIVSIPQSSVKESQR